MTKRLEYYTIISVLFTFFTVDYLPALDIFADRGGDTVYGKEKKEEKVTD